MSLGGGGSSTPAPTAEEKALAWRGAQQFNDYVERYLPLEDKLIELATPRADLADRLRGEASATAAQGLKGAYQQRVAADYQHGGGGNTAGLGTVSNVYAGAAAQGASVAGKAVKERELKAKTKLTAFGRGLADQSTLNLSRAGTDATRLAIEKFKADQRQSLANMEALGTIGGALASGAYEGYRDFKKANPGSSFGGYAHHLGERFGLSSPRWPDHMGP